jgi:hypothetical protein
VQPRVRLVQRIPTFSTKRLVRKEVTLHQLISALLYWQGQQ